VVLDFPANTRKQRAWFRQLLDVSHAEHELHFIVASDEICKRQLRERSAELRLSPGTKWTTDADFEEVTAYFDPPSSEEGFNIARHERSTWADCPCSARSRSQAILLRLLEADPPVGGGTCAEGLASSSLLGEDDLWSSATT
jgi:hypothetical protein